MDIARHDSLKWWARWRHRTNASQPDALVATWKAAWLRGATAVWQRQDTATNPYETGIQRSAWDAGAKWARENPDRRTKRAPRFAHPRRRADDSKLPATLKRAAAVGATGLTLYAITKTLQRWTRPGVRQ
jgi:hypothetical protein